jgi:uncharacterized protein
VGLHLIVDGYNVIRQSPDMLRQERCGLEQGRHALLTRLDAYKRVKAWPITVVFDGASGFHLMEKSERIRGINVIFSPVGRTADEVIIRLAAEKGARAVVVTSDKPLAATVERYGAVVMDSLEFENRLELACTLGFKDDSLEEEDSVPTFSTRKKGPSKRRPRTQRMKNKRLKKI